jgi:hypothetical protein
MGPRAAGPPPATLRMLYPAAYTDDEDDPLPVAP